MNNILSIRCNPVILANMKKAAAAEKKSLRQLIEQMREDYKAQTIWRKIRESYSTMWQDEIDLAEEDMASYFNELMKYDWN